jgi:hypothetical protein
MVNFDAAGGVVGMFSNAAVCASILPAVKLMLVMLQAQSSSNPAATSHINADGGNEQWAQVQAALSASMNVAQAVAAGRLQADAALRSKPGVQQLLAAPELHQLLLITAAWLAGLLHQQKQGRAAVHTASVVRSLSNSSAAAAYALDGRSSSSSTIQVAPHHIKVLELLGAPALDSRKHSDPASCRDATDFCSTMLAALNSMLPAVLKAAGFCLEFSSGMWTADRTVPATMPASGGAATCGVAWQVPDKVQAPAGSSWRELTPALTRMLAAVVQLEPCLDARHSALMLLNPVVRQDMQLWQQPAGAAVVGEMLMQLGPAVLHAHQQQQSQRDAKNCQFALWYWAVTLMNTVQAGGCCMCGTLHWTNAGVTCQVQCMQQLTQCTDAQPCSADTTISYAADFCVATTSGLLLRFTSMSPAPFRLAFCAL